MHFLKRICKVLWVCTLLWYIFKSWINFVMTCDIRKISPTTRMNLDKNKLGYLCCTLKIRHFTSFCYWNIVTFAVDFVPLTVEFGAFAVEFVSFAVEFVALALQFIALAIELDTFAMRLGTFALELVAFALKFVMAVMTPKTNYLSQREWFSPWRMTPETDEGDWS